jgi:hypothetical protein
MDTHTHTPLTGDEQLAASRPAPSRRRFPFGPLVLLLLLVPSASHTQARRRCPQYARVPGYGACINIAGNDCGFCTYRCNDDTVVRWNVCGQ